MAKRPAKKAVGKSHPRKAPEPSAFQISPRVARQALARPYRWQRGDNKPVSRQLWIYTLDPSVSDRLGGVAKVDVPWEPLEPGPKGELFEIDGAGAPAPLIDPGQLDLEDPHWLVSDGAAPSPANAAFHLQMVYAVCSLTYAAFRRALAGRGQSEFLRRCENDQTARFDWPAAFPSPIARPNRCSSADMSRSK